MLSELRKDFTALKLDTDRNDIRKESETSILRKDYESDPSDVPGDTESDMVECTVSGDGWITPRSRKGRNVIHKNKLKIELESDKEPPSAVKNNRSFDLVGGSDTSTEIGGQEKKGYQSVRSLDGRNRGSNGINASFRTSLDEECSC